MKTEPIKKSLPFFSIFILLEGAAGSIVFTWIGGRNNSSVLLRLLFMGWVVSPYLALLAIHFYSRIRLAISDANYLRMISFITLFSLLAYSGILSPEGMKPAFVFLVVPFISWLIIVLASLFSQRRKKTDN